MIAPSDAPVLAAAVIAVVLSGVALALAIAALTARALFVACVFCALLSAVAAVVLLAQGAALPAIALAIFGAALLPLWFLAGLLLSGNAVKTTRRRAPWLTLVAALATAALIVAVAPDLAITHGLRAGAPSGLPALVGAVIFVAAISVIGLLGFGERGALERRERGAP